MRRDLRRKASPTGKTGPPGGLAPADPDNENPLRVIFIGWELRILDELRRGPVRLLGAYLPPSYYLLRNCLPSRLRKIRLLEKKCLGVYGTLADYLARHKIKALRSSGVNAPSFLRKVGAMEPHLGIVANFGQMLGAELLKIPEYGFINFHPSLLPRYRGPEPLAHILRSGDTRSGGTWYRMTEKPDQGPILAQQDFRIESGDTTKDLFNKSLAVAVDLLFPLLRDMRSGNIQPRPQNESEATYYPKLFCPYCPESKID